MGRARKKRAGEQTLMWIFSGPANQEVLDSKNIYVYTPGHRLSLEWTIPHYLILFRINGLCHHTTSASVEDQHY